MNQIIYGMFFNTSAKKKKKRLNNLGNCKRMFELKKEKERKIRWFSKLVPREGPIRRNKHTHTHTYICP